MSILPQTVCRRCHRKYPALRSSCPNCGYKNERSVRRAVSESDSVVQGTEAAQRARESRSWQTLIGGILIVCVIVAMIAVISVNMKARVDDTAVLEDTTQVPEVDIETTPVPVPTPTPTPTPTPAPTVTSVQITFMGADEPGFMEGTGTNVQLGATWYPANIPATVEWSSSDESVATVDDTGLVKVVGESGETCVIYATVGGVSDSCDVWVR